MTQGQPTKNHFVLLSGGIDSAAACFWLLEQGIGPAAIAVHSGGTGDPQRAAAVRVAEAARIHLHDVEAPPASRMIESLLAGVASQPDRPRDPIVFAELASWLCAAGSIGYPLASSVTVGLTSENTRDYPALTSLLLESLSGLVSRVVGAEIEVYAPFIRTPKWQVVARAAAAGVPLDLTWSCEGAGRVHCGHCAHCRDRIDAFARAGLHDPTAYAATPDEPK